MMNSYYSKIFHNIDDGLAILKIEQSENDNQVCYSIIETNEVFQNIIDKSSNEITNQYIFDIFPDINEDWNSFLGSLNNLCRFNKTITYINSCNKYFLIKGVYIDSSVLCVLFVDITNINIFNKTLKPESIKLEEIAKQLEATKQKLIEEDKMASIGQLSAGIAHEINNPLGFVLSNFETLKKYIDRFKRTIFSYREFKSTLLSTKADNYCNYIELINKIEDEKNLDFILEDLNELFNDTEDGLERVRKIVLALRTFSRQDQDGVFEQYDLNSGIETTLLIAKNEIKYTAVIDKDLGNIPLINANSGQINQVFLNIIINACHAIKDKHSNSLGLIKIKTFCDDTYVYCCIEDNGTGIAKENLQNIFNAFFTTKPLGIGTGLGLSISYDIIKNKHHGDIILESKQNEYTIMTIKLPLNLE
jgi:signal transduction histidine kinase